MNQVKIDRNVFIPMPVTLVGTLLKGKANFMAAGWVSRVNANPPWIGIGIGRTHATPEGIIANKSFSICFHYLLIKRSRRRKKSSPRRKPGSRAFATIRYSWIPAPAPDLIRGSPV